LFSPFVVLPWILGLFHSIDFLDLVEQGFGRQQVLFAVRRPDVLITNHPLLIDNNVRPFRQSSIRIPNAESAHNLAIPIAQQRVLDFGEIHERFLRKDCVGADAENFGVFYGKFFVVVVRTGRREMFDSGRAIIQYIEVDQDVFPAQITELEFAAGGAVKLKVRGRLSHFYGTDESGS
jgi:hypothetical protein